MQFNDLLNEYMTTVGCTAKELARVSGLSPAAISRYRSGARLPARDSEQVHRLARGIATIAHESGVSDFDERIAFAALNDLAQRRATSGGHLAESLNKLIVTLGINVNQLAKFANYDASYISRIRSGQRSPSSTERFAAAVATYVVRICTEPAQRQAVAHLLETPQLQHSPDADLVVAIQEWLCSSHGHQPPVEMFLHAIDDFDAALHSIEPDEGLLPKPDATKEPPAGIHWFWGVEGLMRAELEFMDATLTWRQPSTITVYSDMPLGALFSTSDFTERWSAWLAMLLKRGNTVQVIHNVERPMPEMLEGVRSWLPLYLTGKVRSLYLRPPRDPLFNHVFCVADACALSGEGVAGHLDQCGVAVYFDKDDITKLQARMRNVCDAALPLVEVFQAHSRDAFKDFMVNSIHEEGERRIMRSTLPLHTISPELLDAIIERVGMTSVDARRLRRQLRECRQLFESLIERDVVIEHIPVMERECYEANPVRIGLSSFFFHHDVTFTFEEYRMHLELTRAFSNEHANYRIVEMPEAQFSNLQIVVCHDRWAMVSKCADPEAHFLIRHPRLVQALEAFISH